METRETRQSLKPLLEKALGELESNPIPEGSKIVTPTQFDQLQSILRLNMSDIDDLIKTLQARSSILIEIADSDPITVPLDPNLLSRLQTRAIGRDFPTMIREEVVLALQRYAGMR